MRTCLSAAVLSLLLLLGAGRATQGQTAFLCDYTPQQNGLTSLILSGEYHQFNSRYLDNRANVSVGSLLLNGLSWSDGPQWSYNVDGSAQLRFSPAGVALDPNLRGDGQLRHYLDDRPFVFGGLSTSGFPGQAGLTVSALAGAGLGRFLNVTPMAKALMAATILQADGVITGTPSSDTLTQLAQLIGRQPTLGLAGVLEEMEKLIGSSFNVSTVLALQGVLSSSVTRFCGWETSLGLGYELITPSGQHHALLQARTDYAISPDPQSRILISGRGWASLPWTGAHRLGASLDYSRTLSPETDLSLIYSYTQEQDETGVSSETHMLDAVLRMQVRAPLSVTSRGHVGWGTGFERMESGIDLGFEYSLF